MIKNNPILDLFFDVDEKTQEITFRGWDNTVNLEKWEALQKIAKEDHATI